MKLPTHSLISSSQLSRSAVVAALLAILLPRQSKAEDSLTYSHQAYVETGDRISVQSEYGQLDAQLPAEVRLKFTAVIDSISGATPTGELDYTATDPVVLSEMHDKRKAYHAEFTRQFSRTSVSLGLDDSRESDYISDGISINTVTDFNDKNTSLTLGISGTNDDVKKYGPVAWLDKKSYDGIIGVTQLVNPNTTVTANLSFGRADGYLNDPYKLVQYKFFPFPDESPDLFAYATASENRPTDRNKWVLFLGTNHAVPEVGGAVDASYRYYNDTFGVTAHTFTVQWFQKFLDDRLIVSPIFRYSIQGAADFYYPDLSKTTITPSDIATEQAPFYSSDYRLSKMDTIDYGLKVVWNAIPDRLAINASYERYELKGKDGLTASTAYSTADIYNIGVKFSW